MKNAFATIQQAQGHKPEPDDTHLPLAINYQGHPTHNVSNPLGEHLLCASDTQGQRGPLG